MAWTKIIKTESVTGSGEWGESPWGEEAWGGTAGTTWTVIERVTED